MGLWLSGSHKPTPLLFGVAVGGGGGLLVLLLLILLLLRRRSAAAEQWEEAGEAQQPISPAKRPSQSALKGSRKIDTSDMSMVNSMTTAEAEAEAAAAASEAAALAATAAERRAQREREAAAAAKSARYEQWANLPDKPIRSQEPSEADEADLEAGGGEEYPAPQPRRSRRGRTSVSAAAKCCATPQSALLMPWSNFEAWLHGLVFRDARGEDQAALDEKAARKKRRKERRRAAAAALPPGEPAGEEEEEELGGRERPRYDDDGFGASMPEDRNAPSSAPRAIKLPPITPFISPPPPARWAAEAGLVHAGDQPGGARAGGEREKGNWRSMGVASGRSGFDSFTSPLATQERGESETGDSPRALDASPESPPGFTSFGESEFRNNAGNNHSLRGILTPTGSSKWGMPAGMQAGGEEFEGPRGSKPRVSIDRRFE